VYKNMVVRWLGVGVCLVMVMALSSCIQPTSNTDLTKTAVAPFISLTQAASPVPTNPPGVINPTVAPASPGGAVSTPAPAQSLPPVGQFIRDRGDTPNNLAVWDERPLGADRVAGFSYANLNGLPCTGFLLMASAGGTWQPNNGALICAQQPGIEALAAVTFFLTSDGQAYTIVFGRVDNPAVSAIAVVYGDNSSQTVNPVMGGFLILKPGVASVSVITAIDAQGNTVIPNIPQSPV
jgi:hypothetical protein